MHVVYSLAFDKKGRLVQEMTCSLTMIFPKRRQQSSPPTATDDDLPLPAYSFPSPKKQSHSQTNMKAYWYDNLPVSTSLSPQTNQNQPTHKNKQKTTTGRPTSPARQRPPRIRLAPLNPRNPPPPPTLSNPSQRPGRLTQLQEPRRGHNLARNPT
jgi:hypothetical protein